MKFITHKTLMLSVFVLLSVFIVGSYANEFPASCDPNGPLVKDIICDPNAPALDRARDLLSKFNVTDKMLRLDSTWDNGGQPAIPRLGLMTYEWVADGLNGITSGVENKFAPSGPFSSSTNFPHAINTAATFHDILAKGVGNVIGVEARAFSNVGRASLDLWTPNINLFKDPRWGRGQEVAGEDPTVVSRYGYNFIQGMQIGEDPRYYLIVANAKHYAAYDLENWGGVDRYHYNAVVTLQDLVGYYLPPFAVAIRDAQVGSIMCSYNALNGVPTCANDFLLQTLAREKYEFVEEGWVTGDCDAIENIWDTHNYTTTPEAAIAAALQAGADLDCGSFYDNYMQSAYTKGYITEDQLNRSNLRLIHTLVRLGYFDSNQSSVYRSYGWEHVNTQYAQDLSYQIALESITLLKNDKNLLPLTPDIKTIALVGPFVTESVTIQGNYRGQPPYVITYAQGVGNISGVKTTVVKGINVSGNDSTWGEALEAAAAADLTIFIGGIDDTVEAEGTDRLEITFPGVQLQFIQALEGVSKRPIVVATVGGGQVDMTYIKNSPQTGAILWVGYGTQSAGRAFAEVISGNYSPSGRLPITQYPADYVNQVSMKDMSLRPSDTNPGRTYMWYTGTPVFPFAYGLSYSEFNYVWFNPQPTESSFFKSVDENVDEYDIDKLMTYAQVAKRPNKYFDVSSYQIGDYAVNVTNIGSVPSETSVLLFVDQSGSGGPPVKLIDYDRVGLLQVGETTTVIFGLTLSSFATVLPNGDRVIVPGDYKIHIGHGGRDESARKIVRTVRFVGTQQLIDEFPQPDGDKFSQQAYSEKLSKIMTQ
jgi:beta-D-xylosidase 4